MRWPPIDRGLVPQPRPAARPIPVRCARFTGVAAAMAGTAWSCEITPSRKWPRCSRPAAYLAVERTRVVGQRTPSQADRLADRVVARPSSARARAWPSARSSAVKAPNSRSQSASARRPASSRNWCAAVSASHPLKVVPARVAARATSLARSRGRDTDRFVRCGMCRMAAQAVGQLRPIRLHVLQPSQRGISRRPRGERSYTPSEARSNQPYTFRCRMARAFFSPRVRAI